MGPGLGCVLRAESWSALAVASVSQAMSPTGRSSTLTYPHNPSRQTNPVVLLLDGDEEFRIALAETLRDDGYEVLAYALLSDLPPLETFGRITALVIDCQTSVGDGVMFADKFHALHPDAPVVATVLYGTALLEAVVAASPYMWLLHKPIEYTTLIQLFHSEKRDSQF